MARSAARSRHRKRRSCETTRRAPAHARRARRAEPEVEHLSCRCVHVSSPSFFAQAPARERLLAVPLSARCGRSRVSACGWLQRGAAGGARSGSSTRERQAGLACSAPCPPAPAFGRRLLLYLRRTRQPVLTLCHLYGIGCAGTCVGTLRWHWAGGGGEPAAAGKGGDASRQDGVGGHGGSRFPAALGHAPALARSSTQYEGQQWAASGLPIELESGAANLTSTAVRFRGVTRAGRASAGGAACGLARSCTAARS